MRKQAAAAERRVGRFLAGGGANRPRVRPASDRRCVCYRARVYDDDDDTGECRHALRVPNEDPGYDDA